MEAPFVSTKSLVPSLPNDQMDMLRRAANQRVLESSGHVVSRYPMTPQGLQSYKQQVRNQYGREQAILGSRIHAEVALIKLMPATQQAIQRALTLRPLAGEATVADGTREAAVMPPVVLEQSFNLAQQVQTLIVTQGESAAQSLYEHIAQQRLQERRERDGKGLDHDKEQDHEGDRHAG